MKRILILGNFDVSPERVNGQSVKTVAVYNLLKDKFNTQYKVEKFDTATTKGGLVGAMSMLRAVAHCDILMMMPGGINNVLMLLPIYFVLSKLCKFSIVYPVVGTFIGYVVAKHRLHRWMLKSIHAILIENPTFKRELENMGFKNVGILYNFRPYPSISQAKSVRNKQFRIVFLARVCEDKGVFTLLETAHQIKNKGLHKGVCIDIYGPIADDATLQRLTTEIEPVADFVKYYGPIHPSETFGILSAASLYVLPSHYYSEGLPGSLVESFMVGTPAVVSDWRFLPDFIENGINGFTYDVNRPEEFSRLIIKLIKEKDIVARMRQSTLEYSRRFSTEAAATVFQTVLHD